MSTSSRSGYHHGDLRAALLRAATEMLEAGEPFSLRAVARRAEVSATAPYRHFADREALEAAVAVEGFRELQRQLTAHDPAQDAAELGVTYVDFALHHPAVFRLMFGQECDDEDDERLRAAAELEDLLSAAVAARFPGRPTADLATALWSLAHGLAFLHLDGKFRPEPASEVAARVRTSFAAVLGAD